jgi:prolyl-tRNA synthetase
LREAGVRVHVDDRQGVQPGFKFNDWEMRGVPVRMEIGPKDVEKGQAVLARRDVLGKAGKSFVSQDGIVQTVRELLDAVQAGLLEQATAFRNSHLHEVTDGYDHFVEVIQGGEWALSWFCGGAECEAKVKQDAQAVSRCFPLEQPHAGKHGKCIICGGEAHEMAYFAKAY